jgi:hypothetical protein
MIIALARFFQRERVPEGRERGPAQEPNPSLRCREGHPHFTPAREESDRGEVGDCGAWNLTTARGCTSQRKCAEFVKHA